MPEAIHSTLVRVLFDTFHTDEGVVGYTMQNANLRDGGAIIDVLHDLYAPQVIGEDPIASEALWQKLRRLNRHAYNLSDGIAGAIDVAVWDIRGKVAGMPIASMLGLAREKIPAYATARNIEPTPEDVFEEAKERKAQGYHGFKIQFWDGLDRDIPRFRAAREAVGDDYPLMQDAAGMYTYTQALAAGKVLGDLGYEWFEEPIPDRNLFQLQRLTEQLDVPILAGETSRVHELAEMIRIGACDIARGDVHMKEGITGLHKAAGMADLLGFELEVHGINQPLLDTANLHVALSMTNGRWSETFHPIYYRGLKGGPLDIDAEGYKHLPPGPGPRGRARLGLDRRQHPLDAADACRLTKVGLNGPGALDDPVDVLVCGGGMAGLCAAASAVEAGARPLVIEKGAAPGGSMLMSGGTIWTAPTMEVMEAWVPGGDRVRQRRLVEGLAPGLAWLDSLGVVRTSPISSERQIGAEVDTAQLTARLIAAIESGGGRVRTEAALESIALGSRRAGVGGGRCCERRAEDDPGPVDRPRHGRLRRQRGAPRALCRAVRGLDAPAREPTKRR